MSLSRVLLERAKRHEDVADMRARGEDPHFFIPTGIPAWDKNGGVERGVLSIIGGHTGEGKSTILLQLMRSAAQAGYGVLVLSFEDPKGKTADRLFAQATGVNARTLGLMQYEPTVLEQLRAAVTQMAPWARRVDFRDGLIAPSAAARAVKESTAELVLIDYAQALTEADEDGGRESMLRKISQDLNLHAQQSDKAIVMFSQIKPEVELRGKRIWDKDKSIEGYRPVGLGSDLVWASAMAHSAKSIVYIFRPGRWLRKHDAANAKDDTIELIFQKSSFGAEGDIVLGWNGATATIYSKK